MPEWPPTPAASQRKPNGVVDLEKRTRGPKRARSSSPPPARAQPAHAPAASSGQTTSKPKYLRKLTRRPNARISSGERYDAVPPADSSSEEPTVHVGDLEPEPLQTSLSYLIRELQWRSKEKQAPRHRGLKGRSWAHWLIVVVRARAEAHSAESCSNNVCDGEPHGATCLCRICGATVSQTRNPRAMTMWKHLFLECHSSSVNARITKAGPIPERGPSCARCLLRSFARISSRITMMSSRHT